MPSINKLKVKSERYYGSLILLLARACVGHWHVCYFSDSEHLQPPRFAVIGNVVPSKPSVLTFVTDCLQPPSWCHIPPVYNTAASAAVVGSTV